MRHCRLTEIVPMATRQGLNNDWINTGHKLPWRVAALETQIGVLGIHATACETASLATETKRTDSTAGRRRNRPSVASA
jgi:hypothetical protein